MSGARPRIGAARRLARAGVDTARAAARSLGANLLRSALTLLGIVIGIVAVVAMAATTEGLRRKINADLSQLGTGVFQVQKEPMGFGRHDHRKYEKRKNFTPADVVLLQNRCQECLRVAGEAWTFGQSISSRDRTSRQGVVVAGGTAGFFDNNGYALGSGRFFTEGEDSAGVNLVVIGADIVDVLFPNEEPLGQSVRLGHQTYRVIGVLQRRGAELGGGSQDNLVVVPLSTFLLRYGMRRSLNLTIQVRDPERVRRAQDEVISILRKARGVAPEAENDFEMFSNESMQEEFEKLTGSIAAASIGICAIALLIGGIGVMNIMLVSVTERTAEIGIRRALGARRRRILGQFISESVLLTSVGGLLGLALGWGVAALVRVLVGIPTVVPAWAVAWALVVSASTGLIFGSYPAWRASRLDPVEAMRHE
ncbi:MAG TPA: ABC transporter permease [Polyangia bacterium]